MCGIVGYIGSKRACPVLIDGLLSLEYRGYDSSGLAVINSSSSLIDSNLTKFSDDIHSLVSVSLFKSKGRVNKLESIVSNKNIDGTVGIAHTRWATHGEPSDKNAHPQVDNFNEFYVVHNGIIENYDFLKRFLIDNGYVLHSDTDTEVVPNLIHYYFHKNDCSILSAFSMALKNLEGSYAIEMISSLFPDRIFIAKKDSPIVVGSASDGNYIASDIPAILNHTNKFYFINDFEIGIIYKNTLEFYDIDLNSINKKPTSVDYDAISYDKNGFDDYMLKEIYDQPKAIRETIGTSFTNANEKINLPIDDVDFKNFNKIYIIACGTAMHAGLAAKYAFEKFAKLDTIVDTASEFRYRNPLIDSKTLCIFISQSGETADTIAALKLAKSNGATTISIVNVVGSSITRVSDYVLYTHAGCEIAVASTKAYTCQVVLLTILSLYIGEKLSTLSDSMAFEMKEQILALSKKVKSILSDTDQIKDIAKNIYHNDDMFFIGRLSDYAVAMEGSLKLKEISYIHSEAYSAGELKHGPIALIENGVDVIGIATNDSILSKTLNNLEEVVTRGANVILITNQDSDIGISMKAKSVIHIPRCDNLLSPILSVIPLQLLAYYIAKFKKLDVDKPRNLAKSVTVE